MLLLAARRGASVAFPRPLFSKTPGGQISCYIYFEMAQYARQSVRASFSFA
jgi:hypothetical protein